MRNSNPSEGDDRRPAGPWALASRNWTAHPNQPHAHVPARGGRYPAGMSIPPSPPWPWLEGMWPVLPRTTSSNITEAAPTSFQHRQPLCGSGNSGLRPHGVEWRRTMPFDIWSDLALVRRCPGHLDWSRSRCPRASMADLRAPNLRRATPPAAELEGWPYGSPFSFVRVPA